MEDGMREEGRDGSGVNMDTQILRIGTRIE
jgi:hypothetical protein